MAETYLAERRARTAETGDALAPFGRAVCLKLILPEHLQEPTFKGWFLDEARIHAHLHHDNVVQVYDFGELEGRAYLVLEYVEGCDLRALMNWLRDECALLPRPLVVAIAHDLAAALDCAHGLTIDGQPQKLVHRDVSPHNVLMSLHGRAKLCDFGVVKAQSRVMRTETGGTKGKVPYMSPEQLSAPHLVDARTDLFALGVVLFELLTGAHPFRVTGLETDMEVARRIFEGARARVLELAPGTPVGLAAIVEQLLATDADSRVPSAARLIEMLEAEAAAPTAATARELASYVYAAREGLPRSSVTPSKPPLHVDAPRSSAAADRQELATWPRLRSGRRPWLTLAAALALGTAVGALVIMRVPTIEPDPIVPRRSVPPALPMPPTPEAARVSEPAPAAASTSLSSASVGLAAPAQEPGEARARHGSLGSSGQRPVRPAFATVESKQPLDAWLDISVAPDGRSWRVWVDGQYQGTADVKVKVAAGKHTVAVGLEQPSRVRTVHVPSQSSRSLSFR